jgi:macrolide-specific efflux system membrane fusion protein
MEISTYFAESDATKIKAGQAATITWSALSNTSVSGKVASISPTATTENSVNSYAVTISLDSLPTGIRIGQSTTVVVTIAEADNVLRVPKAAVRTVGSRHTVNVVTNGVASPVSVEIGVEGDSYTEIKSGLTAGQTVTITTTVTTTSSSGTGNFPGGGGNFGGGGNLGGGGNFGGGGR